MNNGHNTCSESGGVLTYIQFQTGLSQLLDPVAKNPEGSAQGHEVWIEMADIHKCQLLSVLLNFWHRARCWIVNQACWTSDVVILF